MKYRLRDPRFFLFFYLCVSLSLWAQQTNKTDQFGQNATDTALSMPFVRQISAKVQGNTVHLTWIDAPDSTGPVYIYRKFLNSATGVPTDLAPVQIPRGIQSFLDPIQTDGLISYLILATDRMGLPYNITISNTNYIEIEVEKPALQLTEVNSVQYISSIKAEVNEDYIIISFTLNESQRTASRPLVLYRSTQPITYVQDLVQAVIVQGGITESPFIDYPVPDIAYYYALVFEDDIKQGRLNLVPGKNTTIVPAEVPAGSFRIGLPGPQKNIRSTPLPTLSITATVPGAVNNILLPPVQLPLSPEAAKAVASLPMPEPKKPALKKPRVFAQDLNASGGGEEFTLRSIVQGPFSNRDWNTVINQLVRFLSLPRTATIEARSHFYLGQAYYMTGKNREALFEFLLMKNLYPQEAQEWIQSILPLLSNSTGM